MYCVNILFSRFNINVLFGPQSVTKRYSLLSTFSGSLMPQCVLLCSVGYQIVRTAELCDSRPMEFYEPNIRKQGGEMYRNAKHKFLVQHGLWRFGQHDEVGKDPLGRDYPRVNNSSILLLDPTRGPCTDIYFRTCIYPAKPTAMLVSVPSISTENSTSFLPTRGATLDLPPHFSVWCILLAYGARFSSAHPLNRFLRCRRSTRVSWFNFYTFYICIWIAVGR